MSFGMDSSFLFPKKGQGGHQHRWTWEEMSACLRFRQSLEGSTRVRGNNTQRNHLAKVQQWVMLSSLLCALCTVGNILMNWILTLSKLINPLKNWHMVSYNSEFTAIKIKIKPCGSLQLDGRGKVSCWERSLREKDKMQSRKKQNNGTK